MAGASSKETAVFLNILVAVDDSPASRQANLVGSVNTHVHYHSDTAVLSVKGETRADLPDATEAAAEPPG
jgi:hypothetical protein